MNLSNVVEIGRPPGTEFTIEEARNLLPIIKKITKKAELSVTKLLEDQSFMIKTGAPKEIVDSYDQKVGEILKTWGGKITRLGGRVFGSGLIGFNNGIGYWSWHHTEETIEFYHGYDEDPMTTRRKVAFIERQKN